MYDSIGRSYPRRFVLPLNITKDTPLEQNLNTRPDSMATAVCRTKNQVCTFALVTFSLSSYRHIVCI